MDNEVTVEFDPDMDPNVGAWNSDGTITITLDDDAFNNYTISTSSTIDIGNGINVSSDYGSITGWGDFSGRFKTIDLELLEKYPAAKNLYEQFVSVYNICEAEEELHGDDDDIPF